MCVYFCVPIENFRCVFCIQVEQLDTRSGRVSILQKPRYVLLWLNHETQGPAEPSPEQGQHGTVPSINKTNTHIENVLHDIVVLDIISQWNASTSQVRHAQKSVKLCRTKWDAEHRGCAMGQIRPVKFKLCTHTHTHTQYTHTHQKGLNPWSLRENVAEAGKLLLSL